MALRNQPYLPLYVQDFMTDEKLNECSAESTGVYIKIMCVMHKSDDYGTILLKQKDKQVLKQTDSKCLGFAYGLARNLNFSVEVIERALIELVSEGVLNIDGDKLLQKRMIKDNTISTKRAEAGKKGGESTQFAKANLKAKPKARVVANSETETETENEINNKNKNVIKNIDSAEWKPSIQISKTGTQEEYCARVDWWKSGAYKDLEYRESLYTDFQDLTANVVNSEAKNFFDWCKSNKKQVRRTDLNAALRNWLRKTRSDMAKADR